MKNYRKGTMIDMLFIVVTCVVLGILIISLTYIFGKIYPELNSKLNITKIPNNQNKVNEIITTGKSQFVVLDYIFLFLYFGLCMCPIIFALMVQNHPIFFILNLLMIIIFFFVIPPLSNVVKEFWEQPEFAQYAAGGSGFVTYNVMTRVFQYLPMISIGISIILMIAMFSKGRAESL